MCALFRFFIFYTLNFCSKLIILNNTFIIIIIKYESFAGNVLPAFIGIGNWNNWRCKHTKYASKYVQNKFNKNMTEPTKSNGQRVIIQFRYTYGRFDVHNAITKRSTTNWFVMTSDNCYLYERSLYLERWKKKRKTFSILSIPTYFNAVLFLAHVEEFHSKQFIGHFTECSLPLFMIKFDRQAEMSLQALYVRGCCNNIVTYDKYRVWNRAWTHAAKC